MLAAAVCLVLALRAAAAGTEPAEAVTVGGERYQAELVAVDVNWLITFRDLATERRLAAADLVAWGAPAEALGGPHLRLADGGRLVHLLLAEGGLLVAELLKSDERHLEVRSPLFGEVALPLERIAGVMLHPPLHPERRDRLAGRLSSAEGGDPPEHGTVQRDAGRSTDRMILENGDELTGTILGLTSTTVEFEAGVGPVEVEADKVAALAFNPSLLAPLAVGPGAPGRCVVGLRDGSRLVATTLVLDGQQARFTLAGGGDWCAPSDAVVFLQPLGGQAVYLSDLPAASYRHLPFLSLSWPYHADLNVVGTQLRAGGRLYLKGIGMHSASRLTYRLERPYHRFEADLAIDDHAAGRGSVVCRVFADGNEKYQSEVIRGGTPPLPISVDITGARQLSLIVDFADRGDELDRADWLNARLVE